MLRAAEKRPPHTPPDRSRPAPRFKSGRAPQQHTPATSAGAPNEHTRPPPPHRPHAPWPAAPPHPPRPPRTHHARPHPPPPPAPPPHPPPAHRPALQRADHRRTPP